MNPMPSSINAFNQFAFHAEPLQITRPDIEELDTPQAGLSWLLTGDSGHYYVRGSATEREILFERVRQGTITKETETRIFEITDTPETTIPLDVINTAIHHSGVMPQTPSPSETFEDIVRTLETLRDHHTITRDGLDLILGAHPHATDLNAGEMDYLNSQLAASAFSPDDAGALDALAHTIDTIYDGVLAPEAPDLSPQSDTGSDHTDDKTRDTTPTLTVHLGADASEGDIVSIRVDGTTVIQHTLSHNEARDHTVTLPLDDLSLGDGDHTFTAQSTDSHGHLSSWSQALTVTVDTSADTGTKLSLALSADSDNHDFKDNRHQSPEDANVAGDSQTNDTTPTLTLTGIDSDAVKISVTVEGDKTYTITRDDASSAWTGDLSAFGLGKDDTTIPTALTTDTLDDGKHTVSIAVVDDAGNQSPETTSSFTVDTVVEHAASNKHDSSTNFYDLNLGTETDVKDMYVIRMHYAKSDTDIITFTRVLDGNKHFTDEWTVNVAEGYKSTLRDSNNKGDKGGG